MTTAVIPFAFEDRLVRVVKPNGAPWFVGKDVCGVLGIRNDSDALGRLDPDERSTYSVPTPSAKGVGTTDPLEVVGNEQSVVIVSEPGVYRLIFTSRKPEAERFKRWLAHEVLPALRTRGFYSLTGEPVSAYEFPREPVPLEALRLKLETVRMAYRVFGPYAARALWDTLGLPPVPGHEPVKGDEASRCLWHLLEQPTQVDEQGTVARRLRDWIEIALNNPDDGGLRDYLRDQGILLLDDGETGFLLANSHPFLAMKFAGTPWRETYPYVLRRLPGAHVHKPMRFGPHQRRCTFIPAELLEPKAAAPPPPAAPSNVVPFKG